MDNLIRFEHWRPLNDKALQLCKAGESLHRYFALNSNPPADVLQRYFERFKELLGIIDETREKCSNIIEFLDHDFNNYLTPLSILLRGAERKPSERNLLLIRQNLYINRIVRHVLGSVSFYIDGKLETRPLSLTDFLLSEKQALERAFGREGRKVQFNLEKEYVVEVHEDTLANMLLNMAKNASRHGEADLLDISATDDGSNVHLMVSDNGMGIDPLPGEENPEGKITDIMKRKVSRSGGKGLGLADLKERMAAMGGEVTCFGHGGLFNEKTDTMGAQFWFVLPIVKTAKPPSNFPPAIPSFDS